jgi:hypothetical protein
MRKLLEIKKNLRYLEIALLILVIITLLVFIHQLHRMFCGYTHYPQNSFYELVSNPHFLKFLFYACFGLLTLYVAGKELKKHTDMACIEALTELRRLLTTDTNRKVHLIFAQKEEQEMLLWEEIKKEEEEMKMKVKMEVKVEEVIKEVEEEMKEEEVIKEEEKEVEEEEEMKVQMELKVEEVKPIDDKILEKEGLTRDKEGYIISKNMPMIDYLNYLGTIGLGIDMVRRELIEWETFRAHFGYRIENIFDEEKNPNHIKIREHINNNKSYYKQGILWAKREIENRNIK